MVLADATDEGTADIGIVEGAGAVAVGGTDVVKAGEKQVRSDGISFDSFCARQT